MRPRVTVVVWLLVAAMAAPSQAQTCAAGAPGVNKPGFRPHAVVAYALVESPSGRPFPDAARACVHRAFASWTDANAASALGVRFVPGDGGVIVRFDDERGRLPSFVAAAWSDGARAADGALERATILLSPNPRLMDSCAGITKAVLHELGHLHGLADHRGPHGSTVMNDFESKNDRGGRVPLAVTPCDAWQASRASAVLSAERPVATRLASAGPENVAALIAPFRRH